MEIFSLSPSASAGGETVYDDAGAKLLMLEVVPAEGLILGRWYGDANPESVRLGANAVIAFSQRHPECSVALSDGTHIRGEWLELLPWICYDFLPSLIDSGVKALAFLAPEDPATRLGITSFALAARVVFPAKLFETEAEARQWLATYAEA